MKLERMHLQNFRCFESLVVEFHPKLTVFTANNGLGKTAILDAVAIGFGRYLTKLPNVKGKTILDTDIKIDEGERSSPMALITWAAVSSDISPKTFNWAAQRKNRDLVISKTTTELLTLAENHWERSAGKLDSFVTGLLDLYSSERTFHLPVVAYYGTDRAVRSEVLRVHRDTKKNESRFQALAGALDSSSRFREGLEWFTRKEDEARREREDRGNLAYRLPELELVRQAIERVLGSNFSNPRTKIRPFRFVIDQKVNGVTHTLRMSQLSDGYRMMLGLVMDFARRMVQANPPTQSGGANPLDLPAIMLIDEVDLHLHPEWQQRVLSDLMRTFPNTQFIVTTHSPQVLSTVKRESIRVIDADGCTLPPYMTYGEPSGSVMHSTMGVDPQPPIPEKEELAQLTQLVDKGEYETPESHRLMTHLQSTLGEHNYQLQRLHRSIRRQEALK